MDQAGGGHAIDYPSLAREVNYHLGEQESNIAPQMSSNFLFSVIARSSAMGYCDYLQERGETYLAVRFNHSILGVPVNICRPPSGNLGARFSSGCTCTSDTSVLQSKCKYPLTT